MIEVSNVSRIFGTFRAVNDVSFSIPTGQIVGLLGPNGAGKTTTMRMITGFLKPTSGTIKIDGTDITENPVESKRKIGYMPESAPLYGDMIVDDYLRYIARMQQQDENVKVPLLCRECGLEEVMHKNIGELSRGYRQRVGLAHALMNDPEILILDEPTSGLDPNQVEDVRALIKEIGRIRTAGFTQIKYLEQLDRAELPEGIRHLLPKLETLDFIHEIQHGIYQRRAYEKIERTL